MFRYASFSCSLLLLLIACSCSQGNPGGALEAASSQQSVPAVQSTPDLKPEQFPSALPADGVQPWEGQDTDGFVVPADRAASSINVNTDFTPGVERFLDSGDAADNLEATRLNGNDGNATSYAMYRVSMGTQQPGIVSVDANLLSGKGYYVGLSNYGTGRWDWQGPFIDNHVRLQAVTDSSGDLTSALGNTFVSVLCPAGSSADVVGIGVNQYDPVSVTAPATPLGLTDTPVPGGLELNWSPVLDPDLAGYAIYHSAKSFSNPQAVGVQRVAYLEGSARHLLTGLTGNTFVAIASVDFSGNESLPTPPVQAAPLPGSSPLQLMSSAPSGLLNDTISLSASGAASYDWDLDGDGVFEIQNDNSGSQAALTTATGIIRPRVVGRDSAGNHTALGGISLIISGNSRPVASANAIPATGDVPLDLTLTGIAEDAEDSPAQLSYAWDLDADGIYDDDTDLTEIPLTYTVPGLYNVKFRVTDSQGAWDVDTISVLATGDDPGNITPAATFSYEMINTVAPFNVYFDASASSDEDGEIVLYEWDWNSDGIYEDVGELPGVVHTFPVRGQHFINMRVTDNQGGRTNAITKALNLPGPWPSQYGDLGNNGLSPFDGPLDDNSRWSVTLGSACGTGTAITPNGTIYIGTNDGKLHALRPEDGSEKWFHDSGESGVPGSPVLTASGNIIFCNGAGNIELISPQGDLLKSRAEPGFLLIAQVLPDESILAASTNGILFHLNQDLDTIWTATVPGSITKLPAVAKSGRIFVTDISGALTAIDPDGSQAWQQQRAAQFFSSPTLTDNGVLLVGGDSASVTALNQAGDELWSYATEGQFIDSLIASYFGVAVAFTDDLGYLYLLDAQNGAEIRKVRPSTINTIIGPVFAPDGNMYFANQDNELFCVNVQGLTLWSADLPGTSLSSPAIGADGTLYAGDTTGDFHAFGTPLP
ncbi:MAG: PQQ-binding-like beta-propeller repeat protein [bacterium]